MFDRQLKVQDTDAMLPTAQILRDSANEGTEVPHTPSSSPPNPKPHRDKPAAACDERSGTNDCESHDHISHVQLSPGFTEDLCWSNGPNDLALQTYFNRDGPNLGGDFNVQGLQPVLRECRGMHRFIMKDLKDRFYIWDEWDGRLFWIKDAELENLANIEEKLEWILCELGGLEVEVIYRDCHPAGQPNLGTIGEEISSANQDLLETRYVKLDPDYATTLTWSNDPRHLDLHGAFSVDKPNLSSDFHVQGLRPIVKEEDGETWILQDAKGTFYLWDAWDGHLLRVTEKWTKGPELETVEDVVDNIVCNLSFVEDDAIKVFRTYD